MSEIAINPWNVPPLLVAGIMVCLAVYVARIPGKSTASKLLLALFFTVALDGLLIQLDNIGGNSGWAQWLVSNGLFERTSHLLSQVGVPLMVGFAYLLGPHKIAEQRIAISIAVVVATGLAVAGQLLSWGSNEPLDLGVHLITWLWCGVVLLRKRRVARQTPSEFNPRVYTAFAVFFLTPLLMVPVASVLGALGAAVTNAVVPSLFVFVWLLLGAIYLQYAPESTSLGAKFVGAGLAVVLIMTQLAADPVSSRWERLEAYAPPPPPQTINLDPTPEGGYRASGGLPVFHEARGDTLPLGDDSYVAITAGFPHLAYGQVYDSLYVWSNGLIAFGPRDASLVQYEAEDPYQFEDPSVAVLHTDLNPAQGGAVLLDEHPDSLVVTWQEVPRHENDNRVPMEGRLLSAQWILRRDGSMQLSYGHLSHRPIRWSRGISPGRAQNEIRGVTLDRIDRSRGYGSLMAERLPITVGPGEILIREENTAQLISWTRARGQELFRMAIGGFALVLVVIPTFYRFAIRRRLLGLIAALERVNEGDLDSSVPVTVRDEVGGLASSFNKMTHALREARDASDRHAEQLEDRVKERTAELNQTVTRLEATQAQLIEQEKLASLGALTAGIAHEIKNPLNFVNNFAEVSAELADEVAEAAAKGEDIQPLIADLRRNSEQIAKHGRRADNIIRSMMQHARGGESEREKVAVNVFVEEYVNLAWHGIRASEHQFQVELVRDYAEDAGVVDVFPQDLGRVILNLLSNAFDAVQRTTDAKIIVSTTKAGGQVHIRVSDNGPGIPDEIRARVFEPFFTTKSTGEGTGLGLSLSYDIVTKGHGGVMSVSRAELGGAEFSVSLPSTPEG